MLVPAGSAAQCAHNKQALSYAGRRALLVCSNLPQAGCWVLFNARPPCARLLCLIAAQSAFPADQEIPGPANRDPDSRFPAESGNGGFPDSRFRPNRESGKSSLPDSRPNGESGERELGISGSASESSLNLIFKKTVGTSLVEWRPHRLKLPHCAQNAARGGGARFQVAELGGP
jgi:hypothetical protein